MFATAEGTFLTGSAVFFTQVVGLRAAQVGLGLTAAGVVSFLLAYPAGKLTDRIGPKRMWAVGAFVAAMMFGAWPFITSFGGYLAMVVCFEIVENAAGAGRNAYVLDVMPEQERVATQAYMYSALNVGFTLGALIGGVALAVDDLALIRWMPLFTLAIGILNAVFIARLPRAPHDLARSASGRRTSAVKPARRGPLRNVGWMLSSFFSGTMWTNQVLLNVVIPLWLVQATDAPHWLLAWLFGTNTVLCIFLPAYTSRGVETTSDALRSVRIAGLFFVAACLITMATHSTAGLVTMLLVWLGHVAVTGAELYFSGANWAFQAKLMDPARRGEYGGVAEVFSTLGGRWAPALYTFLAMSWHPAGLPGAGWLVIAGISLLAVAGFHPSVRLAERFLTRESIADAPAGDQVEVAASAS
ncbi:MFS transporter [Catellatospora sp. TT07R-123]|uniref:MFS transporter n=1 Tax=Catellatospora sp. TT07R-123 TaxID=2733863 RepID=UPI001B2A02C1|nr:MFS transporter [Catellatospora sp. TT07R-123]GHJ47184.1 MFS transporter [Catellatospora sp. TT07R-123]